MGRAQSGVVNAAVLGAWSASLQVKYGRLPVASPEALGIPLIQQSAVRRLANTIPVLPPPRGKCPDTLQASLRAKYGDLTQTTLPPAKLGIPLVLDCARRELEAWTAK